MKTNHVWVVHVKQGSEDNSKTSGWTPVLREYSEDAANNLASLVVGNKKSAQIKISKHEVTKGKPGPNAEWNPEPVSEKFIGSFSRSPKVAQKVVKPTTPKVVTKGMTPEERVQARRLHNMTVDAKPHARTARTRKRG